MFRTINELKEEWEVSLMHLRNEKPIALPPDIFPEKLETAEIHEAAINGIKAELAHVYGILAGHPKELEDYL